MEEEKKQFKIEVKQLNPIVYEIAVTTPDNVRFIGQIKSPHPIDINQAMEIFKNNHKSFVIDLQKDKDIFFS